MYNPLMKTGVMALFLGFLAGCGSGSTPPAGQAPAAKPPDETAAVAALRELNSAQDAYFKRNRRYALTYEELIEARILNDEPAAAVTGYEIRLRPSADAATYTAIARPATPAPNANHFFTDQSGIIRAEPGKDANKKLSN